MLYQCRTCMLREGRVGPWVTRSLEGGRLARPHHLRVQLSSTASQQDGLAAMSALNAKCDFQQKSALVILLKMSLHMWPCCVRGCAPGLGLEARAGKRALGVHSAMLPPSFSIGRQGNEKTAVYVFVNLAVIWYAIGCQTIPLVKIKPIFQIQLVSQVYSGPLLGCGRFFVLFFCQVWPGTYVWQTLCKACGQGRSLLWVSELPGREKAHRECLRCIHTHLFLYSLKRMFSVIFK